MSITSQLNTLTNNTNAVTTNVAGKKKLEASDFINMMLTQLQNQDPTEPTKSSDLLAQMSQMGSLQASTDLQSSLKTLTLQNSLSNAASMIGKTVTGKDVDGEDMSGIVSSVKIVDGELSLQLDSGKNMAMANVLGVMPTTEKPTAPTTTPSTN